MKRDAERSAREKELQGETLYAVEYQEVLPGNRLRTWIIHETPRLKAAKLIARGVARAIRILHSDWQPRPNVSLCYQYMTSDGTISQLSIRKSVNDDSLFDALQKIRQRKEEAVPEDGWTYIEEKSQLPDRHDCFEDEDEMDQERKMRLGELRCKDTDIDQDDPRYIQKASQSLT